ncbi:MAG: hypothetical protein CL611_04085 [Anaerolineaceae bacterium]|nr:hypothetical protein [Anaerolineaceae bacterium]
MELENKENTEMSKNWRIAGVVGAVAAVAVAALLGARIAFAQTPEPPQGFGPWYRAGGHWRGHGGMFEDNETMHSAVADAHRISVDELEAAHAEGKHWPELADEMTTRHTEMAEKIASGEWPLEKGHGWGRKGPGFGGHRGDCLRESE